MDSERIIRFQIEFGICNIKQFTALQSHQKWAKKRLDLHSDLRKVSAYQNNSKDRL